MTEITVAALQLGFSDDLEENFANVSALVREAAGRGASASNGMCGPGRWRG